ncbi:DUF2780 domain-containing protein [Paraglaciecola polaris]|uniref:DUF2780 domain-containing protein n=1 Tax=Paraglaciecola polaris LMG 21857 TaxID=1129793 RepID=K6ZRT3_9ALTE|nr:DUF2780 domain-containing protein [Paraglaciecola polaris]GAC31553.1 hypothetical protein GPLA_0637 [Paraglaciecola polaris LMG 21857]|tara:strand:+ start:193 stop:762 length:570 start_codon:yes stop_codon:yes gene_type:complete
MKNIPALLIATLTLTLSTHASAVSSLDKLKGLVDSTSSTESVAVASSTSESFDVSSLVSMVSDNLGVSETQSQGGLASIFDYAKSNLSGTDYTQLAGSLPGLDSLLAYAPDIATDSSSKSSGMSGLLSKASEYSSSLSAINELKQQFEALGLDTDMISSFVSQISTYISDDEDTQALLQSGLGKLTAIL